MHSTLSAALITLSITAVAGAQTIYEPLVTQYGGQNPYEYAGSDPAVHRAARYPSLPGSSYGRCDGFAFVSARRNVVEREPRVFTDQLGPHWNPLMDVTIADVINTAHAALPRYFRKSDLMPTRAPEPTRRTATSRAPRIYSRGSIVIIRTPAR